jgi:hypothetical protein
MTKIPDWVDKRMDKAIELANGKPNPNKEVTIPFTECKAETDKAYYLTTEIGTDWYPKSQVAVDVINKTVTMPAWLLDKKKEEHLNMTQHKKAELVDTPSKGKRIVVDEMIAVSSDLLKKALCEFRQDMFPKLSEAEWKLLVIELILET